MQHIVQRQADYIIAIKNSQPGLAQAVEGLFDPSRASALAQNIRVEKGNCRLHKRRCVVYQTVWRNCLD